MNLTHLFNKKHFHIGSCSKTQVLKQTDPLKTNWFRKAKPGKCKWIRNPDIPWLRNIKLDKEFTS